MKSALDLTKKTILIVEDDETSFALLEALLKLKSIKSIWVKDGKEAVAYCQKPNQIDLILMDINMPEMNGYEATRLIKKIRPELPIIAQTAYAIAGDEEKTLAAGCHSCITKPIFKEELYKKIIAGLEKN